MTPSYKEKLSKISEEILRMSRNELYMSMRYLDVALHKLSFEWNVSTRSMGTDGEKILYNPNYLCKLYQEDPVMVNRGYLHMLLHCMFFHMMIREEREEELFNIACDIAVESIIDSMEYKTVHMTSSDHKEEVYEWLGEQISVFSAEAIYRELKKKMFGIQELEQLKRTFAVDDHSMWDATKKDNEKQQQDNPNNKQDNDNKQDNKKDNDNENKDKDKQQKQKQEWQQISEKVATNLATFSKNVGTEVGSLRMGLRVANRERYSYKEFLRKFAVLQEEMTVDMDSFDYITYMYGLSMYKNMPLIEPLEYKEEQKINEFVIAIDTSGSCSGALVKRFLEETYRILMDQTTFSKKINVYIIQCDADIQEVVQISSTEDFESYIKQVEIKGHGGTDFRPVFSFVNELVRQKEVSSLKGMLYFTDGYGTFPERAPEYEVAFVMVGEQHCDVKVPSWAMKLLIEPEEFLG